LICAGIGYGLARKSDENQAIEHRAALRGAISEFRALFGDSGEIDPRFIRMIEQNAGVKALKFTAEPEVDARELQPVLNAEGRIVGFFSWEPDRPMTAVMDRLLPLIAGAALGLLGFAGFSLRQLHRARAELAVSEQRALRAAAQDALTGLPNRDSVLALLDAAMAARTGREIVTFALLELDGMDDVNEQFGSHGGDELIVTIAERLKDALPAGAICGRIDGDEFAVIVVGDGDAHALLRGAIEAAARPYWLDTVVRIGVHAGYAQAPHDATSRDELARRTERALRAARRQGPGAIVAFEPSIDVIASEQQFIRRELPRALGAHALELHYQPIVAADGARLVGVEALLRWTHAERGAIAPATFIPVAEQMGLMSALGAFVLRRALSEAKRWSDLYIAVNLSPLQVRDRAIVDLVRDELARAGVAPSRLILEVTEGVLIDNPDEVVRRIADLHALGVRIALDDFGSGYSNLGYLQRFAFDKLKIDRSFVTQLGRAPNAGVIIQAVVTLGRALGVSVLVEGVETEEQRVLLRLAGCDEMQGYLFARPAPAKAIDRLLAERKAAPARIAQSAASSAA
jgi:diguanylate cyclase (GGDEF)-like protein